MNLNIEYTIECLNVEIIEIMKDFTETDLNDNLSTGSVFDFFSNDVSFSYNDDEVGRWFGYWIFKFFCEYSLVSIDSDPVVSILDKGDYIIWKFECDETRRFKFLPEFLSPLEKLNFDFEANVYFDDELKINRFDITKNKVIKIEYDRY